jgi:hypothetical protein
VAFGSAGYAVWCQSSGERGATRPSVSGDLPLLAAWGVLARRRWGRDGVPLVVTRRSIRYRWPFRSGRGSNFASTAAEARLRVGLFMKEK